MYYKERWTTFKHLKLNFVIRTLIASDFVIWSSINLVSPIFAIFITDHIAGGSIEVVGISTMIYLIAKSLCEIPIGIMIDRTKSEMDDLYVAIGGTMIVGIVYFMYSYVSGVWGLYALQALLGIGTAGAFPGWYAIFTRHIDESKHGVAWSTHDVLLGIGGAVAAGMGAICVERFGLGLVFNCVGVLVIAGAFMLLLVRDEIFVKKI
ncbi:MAG: MFS transporter [Parcubacteria group bacterium]